MNNCAMYCWRFLFMDMHEDIRSLHVQINEKNWTIVRYPSSRSTQIQPDNMQKNTHGPRWSCMYSAACTCIILWSQECSTRPSSLSISRSQGCSILSILPTAQHGPQGHCALGALHSPARPARCHYCEKTISRGNEVTMRLNNGGMINHLQRLHKECVKLYKEKESEGQQKKDSKDETVRGTVPLFSLKNHSERKQFLKLVMKCSIVQRSAV